MLIGDNGVIYAGASGGLQNCDGSCVARFSSLRPSPSICHSVSCSWTENILYQFSGITDAFQGGGLVSDRDGNLYGVGGGGGTDMSGAVFELSPTIRLDGNGYLQLSLRWSTRRTTIRTPRRG